MPEPRSMLLLLAVLAACGGADRDVGAPPPRAVAGARPTDRAAIDPATASRPDTLAAARPGPVGADVVVRELGAIAPEPVTAEAWLSAHAGDVARRVAPDAPNPLRGATPPCLRATAAWRDPAGRTLTRTALFYPPLADDPLPPLPAAVDSTLARTHCRLGAIAVTITDAPPDVVARVADSVRAALARAHGAPETTTADGYWASATWRGYARWRTGDARTGVAVVGEARDRPAYVLAFAHRAVARVGRPVDELLADPDLSVYDDELGSFPEPDAGAAFERALRLAAAPDSVAAPMRALFAAARARDAAGGGAGAALVHGADGATEDGARVAAPVGAWLAATRTLPAPRRAAALVAADAILRHGARFVPPGAAPAAASGTAPGDSGAAVRALTAIGARYEFLELGGEYAYAGNWLREAREVDPDGAGGELALLVQLEQGFLGPGCRLDVDVPGLEAANRADGMEAFRAVIAEGEKLLPRLGDATARARVHALVGDAHRDVIVLASGASAYADYADSAAYRPEVPVARERAVAHYRAALADAAAASARTPGAPSPWWARRAWRDAWGLLAGLTPASARFFCVYD